jgi:CBS domain containing-hemolysin-like protein
MLLTYIGTVVVLIIGLIAIELKKGYQALPIKELKYRAANGDELAKHLYKAAAYGSSLEAFLWLVIVLCAAGSLFLITSFAPFWLSFIAIVLLLWLAFAWIPNTKVAVPTNFIVKYSAPVVAKIMNYIYPLLRSVSTKTIVKPHNHIYDHKDLLDVLNKIKNQADSRINPEQLEIIKRSLDLGSIKTTDVAKPWSKVKTATEDETVGPILLDELHKSEQQFIPIKNISEPKVLSGMLDLSKLNINAQARIANYMDRVIYYLNEDDTLDVVLHAFGQTNYPAFVIVDNKQHFIGLLTIGDVINQIIVSQPGISFSEYTDISAVASKYEVKEEETEEPLESD